MNRIASIRMISQQLAAPRFGKADDLVEWMGMVQAQDYTMAKWALGIRLEGGTLGGVNEALAKGEIVRTHVMRPTWHFVAGKDIRWMFMLSGQRIRKSIDQWTKSSGLDIPESLYSRCNDLIGKTLAGHRFLTKDELGVELGKAGIPNDADNMRRYLLRAELERIVCSGGDKAGKSTYALFDEHIAPVAELQRDEALAKLALNYFRSHAPATLADFVWWSGLSVTEAKRGVAALGKQLVVEQIEGTEYLLHESCKENEVDEVIHFLPGYDEYLISYKERYAVISAEHCPKAYNRYGIFYPVILYGGKIVGNWSKAVKKNNMNIESSFFEPGLKVDSRLLELAESRFRAFKDKK